VSVFMMTFKILHWNCFWSRLKFLCSRHTLPLATDKNLILPIRNEMNSIERKKSFVKIWDHLNSHSALKSYSFVTLNWDLNVLDSKICNTLLWNLLKDFQIIFRILFLFHVEELIHFSRFQISQNENFTAIQHLSANQVWFIHLNNLCYLFENLRTWKVIHESFIWKSLRVKWEEGFVIRLNFIT